MDLVRRDGEIRLVGTRSEKDHTDEMEAYTRRTASPNSSTMASTATS